MSNACSGCGRDFDVPRRQSCAAVVCSAFAAHERQRAQLAALTEGLLPDELASIANPPKRASGGGDEESPTSKKSKAAMSVEELTARINELAAKYTAQQANPLFEEAYTRSPNQEAYAGELAASLSTATASASLDAALPADSPARATFAAVVRGSWEAFEAMPTKREARATAALASAAERLKEVEDKLVSLKLPASGKSADAFKVRVMSGIGVAWLVANFQPLAVINAPAYAERIQRLQRDTERVKQAYQLITGIAALLMAGPERVVSVFTAVVATAVSQVPAEIAGDAERQALINERAIPTDAFWAEVLKRLTDEQKDLMPLMAQQAVAALRELMLVKLPALRDRIVLEQVRAARRSAEDVVKKARDALKYHIARAIEQRVAAGARQILAQEIREQVVVPYLATPAAEPIRSLSNDQIRKVIAAGFKHWRTTSMNDGSVVLVAKLKATAAAAKASASKLTEEQKAQARAVKEFEREALQWLDDYPEEFAGADADSLAAWLALEWTTNLALANGVTRENYATLMLQDTPKRRALIEALIKRRDAALERLAKQRDNEATRIERMRLKAEKRAADEAERLERSRREAAEREAKRERERAAREEAAAEASRSLGNEVNAWPLADLEAFVNNPARQTELTKTVIAAYRSIAESGGGFSDFAAATRIAYLPDEGSLGHHMAWERLEQTTLGALRRRALVRTTLRAVDFVTAERELLAHGVPDPTALRVIKRLTPEGKPDAAAEQPLDIERAVQLYVRRVTQPLAANAPFELYAETQGTDLFVRLKEQARQILLATRDIERTMGADESAEIADRAKGFKALQALDDLVERSRASLRLIIRLARKGDDEDDEDVAEEDIKYPNNELAAIANAPGTKKEAFVRKATADWQPGAMKLSEGKRTVYPAYLLERPIGRALIAKLKDLYDLFKEVRLISVADELAQKAAAKKRTKGEKARAAERESRDEASVDELHAALHGAAIHLASGAGRPKVELQQSDTIVVRGPTKRANGPTIAAINVDDESSDALDADYVDKEEEEQPDEESLGSEDSAVVSDAEEEASPAVMDSSAPMLNFNF